MKAISVSDARSNWAALLESLDRRDIILTKHGKPVAVLIGQKRLLKVLAKG